MITPWYIAVTPFDPSSGARWEVYIAWSGLTQLTELVSFDNSLCPNVLESLTAEDWAHNVLEDYVLFFFTDLAYLLARTTGRTPVNILAAVRNPAEECRQAFPDPRFTFKGFDLVDIHGDLSALTNCGGFPLAFSNAELTDCGLIGVFDRACEINRSLRANYPHEHHAQCDIWALWKMADRPLSP